MQTMSLLTSSADYMLNERKETHHAKVLQCVWRIMQKAVMLLSSG